MSEHLAEHHDGHGSDRGGPLAIEPMPRVVTDFQRMAGLVGVISLLLLGLSAVFSAEHMFRSLLFAFWFWVSISLGSLAFVMISHLTGGRWGVVMRRFGEAAFMNLPLMLVFFLVLTLGFKYLFPWMPDNMKAVEKYSEAHGVLEHRQSLFNPTVFTLRNLLYFGIWIGFAVLLRTGSLRLDKAENPILMRSLRKVSAGGIVLFFLTTLFFAIDFILSRELTWYSSIIGFIVDVGMGLSAMAFISLSVCYFSDRKSIKEVLTPQQLNDLGNILLALVILWTYTSFAQFLIQWNGNLPEDVGYYTFRGLGPNRVGWEHFWRFVAALLILGHFLLPFFLLLMKGLKRDIKTFARIALWILCVRVVENLWLIAPSGSHRGAYETTPGALYLTDVLAWAGVGGIWMFFYLRTLASEALLPQNACDQPEILTHGPHGTHAHAI